MTQLRWGGPLVLAMSFLLTSTTTNAVADEKAEQKALNAAIRRSLFDVTDSAVKTHNDGDVNGGYRLYQGGLIAVLPLLNHRPELQKYIKSGMNVADGQRSVEEASFKLRAVVDNVRSALEPGGALPEQKTLWVRLGGDKGVEKIVGDFVALSAKDPRVNFDRMKKYKLDDDTLAKVKKELVKQVSYLADGPDKLEKSPKPSFKEWAILESEFTAAFGNLEKALIMSKVPDEAAQELLTAVFALRKDIVVAKAPPMPVPTRTVWEEALGGEKGVNKIVEDFMAAAIKDPMVNFNRNGKYTLDADTLAKVKKEFVNQISYATGGPYKEVKDAPPPWKGLGITDAEFIAASKHFKAALEKNGLSAKNVLEIQLVVGRLGDQIVEPKMPEPKKPDDKKPDDKKPGDKKPDDKKPDDKKPDDKKPDDKPKDGEVSGTITVDGKPLGSGKISFVGEDKKAIGGEVKDGKYKLSGVKPGMYRITVQAPDVVGAQYSTPFTTPLKGEIVKDKESISLELRGKK